MRDRQRKQRNDADDDHQDGDDIRQHRPLDEELGDHCAAPSAAAALDDLQLRLDLLAGHGRQQAGDDDAVFRLDAGCDHPQFADQLADLDRALLDDVVLAGDEHIAPALVAADGAIRNQQHVRLFDKRHADADEIARQQLPVGVGQDGADGERAGRRSDGRRRIVERPLVRIAGLVLQADFDGDLLQILRGDPAFGHVGADAQHVLLADVEIDVDRIELDDRRKRRGAGAPTSSPDRHLPRGDDAVERRLDLRIAEIELGLLDIGRRLLLLGRVGIALGRRLVEILLRGDDLLGDQLLLALDSRPATASRTRRRRLAAACACSSAS